MQPEKMVGFPEAVVGGTEGDSRPTGVPTTTAAAEVAGARVPGRPDPAVPEKATRRRFCVDDKARILREADQLTEPGQVAALLRLEDLSSSHLSVYRKQRDAAVLDGVPPKRHGRKPAPDSPLVEENKRLQRENATLLRKLRRMEAILDVHKIPPGSWGSHCRRRTR